jgi:hypothetical protein
LFHCAGTEAAARTGAIGLNAEELSVPELNDVMRWCRCIELTAD